MKTLRGTNSKGFNGNQAFNSALKLCYLFRMLIAVVIYAGGDPFRVGEDVWIYTTNIQLSYIFFNHAEDFLNSLASDPSKSCSASSNKSSSGRPSLEASSELSSTGVSSNASSSDEVG